MFPNQKFPIPITNERLLNPKRETIKRSVNARTSSLDKTASSITINPAVPYSFNDYFMGFGFVEGRIDLTNENAGEYQMEVVAKPMIKVIDIAFMIFIPIQIFLIISRFDSYSGSEFVTLFLSLFAYFCENYQVRRAIRMFAERLKEDRAIFLKS